MKIGIFDSGLGGLIIGKAIRKAMPEYDYVYLGDTKRVPYGNRSHEAVYEFTCQGIKYLFEKEDCKIVVLACNTASARALRRIQQEYLPKYFPDRKVLGVLVPTAEECIKFQRVGIVATRGTVLSNTFPNEIEKLNPTTKVFQNPAPMLVPLAEEGETELSRVFIKKYLAPFKSKKIDALVLGCTHYPFYKREIKKNLSKGTKLISQDEFIPAKLKNYFSRHPEIENKLSKQKLTPKQDKVRYGARVLVTDTTDQVQKLSRKWFGDVEPEVIHL